MVHYTSDYEEKPVHSIWRIWKIAIVNMFLLAVHLTPNRLVLFGILCIQAIAKNVLLSHLHWNLYLKKKIIGVFVSGSPACYVENVQKIVH